MVLILVKSLFIDINYKIHEKYLMAIIDVFEEWDHLFKKVKHEIMYFNYKNFHYFMTIHVLN
jgi:hypothetical protein